MEVNRTRIRFGNCLFLIKIPCLPQALSIKGKYITFPWHSNPKIPHKSLLWVVRLQMALRMLALPLSVRIYFRLLNLITEHTKQRHTFNVSKPN